MLRPCIFHRNDWPLTNSCEITFKSLGYLAWWQCLYIPGGLWPQEISVISGGARAWVTKVSHKGAPGLHDWTPNKNLEYRSLGKLPWLAILHICRHRSPLAELSTVDTIPLGEENGKSASSLSWILPYVPFTFANFICILLP